MFVTAPCNKYFVGEIWSILSMPEEMTTSSGFDIWDFCCCWTLSLTKPFKLILIVVHFFFAYLSLRNFLLCNYFTVELFTLKTNYSQTPSSLNGHQIGMNCCCIWYNSYLLRCKIYSFWDFLFYGQHILHIVPMWLEFLIVPNIICFLLIYYIFLNFRRLIGGGFLFVFSRKQAPPTVLISVW